MSAALVGPLSQSGHAQDAGRDAATTGRTGPRGLEIVPTLSLEETYTDNVRLAPGGSQKTSDWVTSVRPGISILANGARARFAANYSAGFVYRARDESRDLNHSLSFTGDAELIRQLMFVDARASVSQQNVSLFGPLTNSDVNVTGNRATVTTFYVSPYVRRNIGQNAEGEVRLTYSAVNTGNRDEGVNTFSTSDSTSNRLDMRLTSGPTFRLLSWNLAYSKERIDYDVGQDPDIDRITATARRLITPTLALQVNVGYEDNNYISTGDAKVEGAFWSLGPEWTPSPRTRLVATAGRRWEDPYYFLDFSHRTRLTTWRVSYTDDVTTQREQLLVPVGVDTFGFLDTLFLAQIPDPEARRRAVQTFINQTGLPPSLLFPVNFFTTTPFSLKRWLASVGIQGVRNTLLANVFRDTREALAVDSGAGAGDFALSNNTRQTGTSLVWTLRMSAQTSSNVGLSYSKNETPGVNREDDLTSLWLNITRQFHPRVSGSLNFRRSNNDSNQVGGSYRENQVSAALFMRF